MKRGREGGGFLGAVGPEYFWGLRSRAGLGGLGVWKLDALPTVGLVTNNVYVVMGVQQL